MLSLASFFVLGSDTLTALGIGIVVVGLTLVAVKEGGETVTIIEGGLANLELLLEDLDVSQRGYYFPRGDRVNVYVPLSGKAEFPEPEGVITVKDGSSVLVLYPPVYVVKDLGKSIDSLVEEYVVERGLADSVKVVKTGNAYVVEVKGNKVRTPGRVKLVMGSCVTSVVASLIALKERRPCFVREERGNEERYTAVVEVVT